MRLLVYGAGAVGSYLGGCLLRQGHDVVLVVRPDAAEALNENGLKVQLPENQFAVHPRAITVIDQAFHNEPPFDAVLLAMKSYDLTASLDHLLAACPNPPTLITLQNGIGLEEQVAKRAGINQVVAGSLTTPIRKEGPEQVIVERANRGLTLAPTIAGQDISNWVALFAAAGVPTEGLPEYQPMKWSKALLNMIGNASAAILDQHPSTIYNYRPTFNLELDMLQETLVVMKRMGLKVVDLPGAPARRLSWALRFVPRFMTQSVLSRLVAGGRGNKMPSFYLDLQAGRRQSEVLYHNVAVAQIAKEMGISAPVNRVLGDTLMGIVDGRIPWSEYRGNPDRLVFAVAAARENNSEFMS